MSRLWIQYSYDDIENAPVIQTADSAEEAEECDGDVMDGCVWYHYRINGSKLINPFGPITFSSTLPDMMEKVTKAKEVLP